MGDDLLCPGGEDVRAEDLVPSHLAIALFAATSVAFDIISVP